MNSTSLTPETPVPFPPPPSDCMSQSTRVYTRPCRCGKSACRRRFFYFDRMILAIHEVLDSLRAEPPPIPTRHARRNPSYHPSKSLYSTSTKPLQYPFFGQSPTRAVFCVSSSASRGRIYVQTNEFVWGVGATLAPLNPGSWICHQDPCVGIDNAILRSVADAWNAEVVDTFIENH
ncbi:uncharacterized protein ARMOST_12267 [Armillaria ostoyae]|uniref:Uncharacterized protein n=1 Tax=Armillaria ostoyae TaxID=47428 RepID=A0A284RJG1_ARMOS|nr:uncharacterized protein ARMOST_12267 [Armillaria ostoyae]